MFCNLLLEQRIEASDEVISRVLFDQSRDQIINKLVIILPRETRFLSLFLLDRLSSSVITGFFVSNMGRAGNFVKIIAPQKNQLILLEQCIEASDEVISDQLDQIINKLSHLRWSLFKMLFSRGF